MSPDSALLRNPLELFDGTTGNVQHAPLSQRTTKLRSGTPKANDSTKRLRDVASTTMSATASEIRSYVGTELLTQVFNAVSYLKQRDSKPTPFEDIISYLSLPNDAQRNIPLIKRALQQHVRVEYVPHASASGKECFEYRPLHPVTTAAELKEYLGTLPTARGIPVSELEAGWPACTPVIDKLEAQGHLLVTRRKTDNRAVYVWSDSPDYHILNPITRQPQKADLDFIELWTKIKLPSSEVEVRTELKKAGLVPTSVVHEVQAAPPGLGEKKGVKKGLRTNGKTTNSHLLGWLKDYSKR